MHKKRKEQNLLWCLLIVATFLLMTGSSQTSFAQEEEIRPGEQLIVQGIPKIPAKLASQVKPYTAAYGLPLAGWDPVKREVWIKGISSTTWVSRVAAPGSTPKMSLYLPQPGLYDLYFAPQSERLIYNCDSEGNEAFQFYLYDPVTRQSRLLTDGKSRSTEPVWSNAGRQIVYSSSPPGGSGVSLHLLNPDDPGSHQQLVASTGNYLKAYDWSPNDQQIVYCEFLSNTISRLWLLNLTDAKPRLLSETSAANAAFYDAPQFSHDGSGLYVITDRDSDYRRLAYLNLKTGKFSFLTTDLHWDVDEFQLSPDGRTLAFVTNEDGLSRLYLTDLHTGQRKAVTALPVGLVSDLKWHHNSADLAFNFKSSRTPNDVYVWNLQTEKLERWVQSITNGAKLEGYPIPSLIHWRSFDGRRIAGFLYRPPAKFTGKRPVIIDLHGGPEEQFRPGFGYDDNVFTNELGAVRICPNVRGSSGYGKSFLRLDDGVKREDAVKDIGALLGWIRKQPDLDADRVLVMGASYGGYLALSVAARYGTQIRAAISDSGPTNLVTFLEHTEGWRRDVRRAEFGDERKPAIRKFMGRTAPLNNIHKFRSPLLIIQGKNDPRVPVAEAEAIVQTAKKSGANVWYLLAKDEGHTFVNSFNREFRLYTIILFIQEHLLRQV